MASDMLTGSLLCTLAASKPSGKFLKLGTGSGLATSWILDCTYNNSTLISFDNDESLLEIANSFLGHDQRLTGKLSKASAFRIGNIGHIFTEDVKQLLLAIKEVVEELGIMMNEVRPEK